MKAQEKKTTLTLQLSGDVYLKLREEAKRLGKPLELVIQEWLAERVGYVPAPTSDRGKARRVLRDAGLLIELSQELPELADSSVDPEEIRDAMARAGGKSLSEIVLEQRGPKG